ncbi:MAG: hypothetical protein R3264_05030 [Anaerolineae bacterium]|nr:hypothetical protein [Anaerolineae bacterium]
MTEQRVMNRFLVVLGALLIQFSLGAIYAWQQGPLLLPSNRPLKRRS